MKTIPKSFTIKGKKWKISYRKKLEGNELDTQGLCVYEKRTILLLKSLTEDEILEVLYHELVHASLYEAHLNSNSGLSSDIEEIICDSIADLLATTFELKGK